LIARHANGPDALPRLLEEGAVATDAVQLLIDLGWRNVDSAVDRQVLAAVDERVEAGRRFVVAGEMRWLAEGQRVAGSDDQEALTDAAVPPAGSSPARARRYGPSVARDLRTERDRDRITPMGSETWFDVAGVSSRSGFGCRCGPCSASPILEALACPGRDDVGLGDLDRRGRSLDGW
jgi:hypothetical protein